MGNKEFIYYMNQPHPQQRTPSGPYKKRLGIWMFAFYSLFYASFVAINLLSPITMGRIIMLG